MSHDHTNNEFTDPRLVAIYDTVNPVDSYRDFIIDLADRVSATTVIDFGCGTGLMTHELAKHGHRVIGVDPNVAMLNVARAKQYDNEVRFIHGDASRLDSASADLAIMTGHVAQFFLDDESWHDALRHLHRALRPGGYLAFDSRHPDAPSFTTWPTAENPRRVNDPGAGEVEWWPDNSARNGNFTYGELHYRFVETGEHLISSGTLRYRSPEDITRDLETAGFTVESILGDYDGSPMSPDREEMIFIAHR